jgi:hypothetical protein
MKRIVFLFQIVIIGIFSSCSSKIALHFEEMSSTNKFYKIPPNDITNENYKKAIGLYNFKGIKINNRNYNLDTLGYWIKLNNDGSMQEIHDKNGIVNCEKGEWKLKENQLFLKYTKENQDSNWVWIWFLKDISDKGIFLEDKNNNKVLVPRVITDIYKINDKCK